MNTLVAGGLGYIGSELVPLLWQAGHKVTVYDAMIFGTYQQTPTGVTVIRGDVRNRDQFANACIGQDAVIYLASISSDAMCQKDPQLADEVNRTSFERNVLAARNAGVRRFIYASSVAAYGSSEFDAAENQPLSPTTLYAKAKASCEAVLTAYHGRDMVATITRSASVCGPAPRMRFDLTVNKMVHDAIRHGRITVNGGSQKRCHIHIQDICAFYLLLLDVPRERIAGEVFNVVAQNQSVLETAALVIRSLAPNVRRARNMPAFIEQRDATDDRSYTVDGAKAREILHFSPKLTIVDAVRGMKSAFDAAQWRDSETNPSYQNLASGYA